MKEKKRKIASNFIEVEMDGFALTNKESDVLITKGISTCIAFVIQGTCYHDDEEVPFCGLYHWSGFEAEVTDFYDEILSVLDDFFIEVRAELEKLGAGELEINVTKLAFIGGEKRQFSEEGQLLLSGTEKEVKMLQKAAQAYDYQSQNINLDKKRIEHHHFLTSDNDSLTIEVRLNECHYKLEDFEETLQESSKFQPS
ncbi:hypothetical protein ACQUW5_05785 [Legionella sp. CNM-1927-20]|uniref:hypothetical protein n=1 Tax=Legionella sp. CNM-1927-20 TaxID=3422221 RepID=UPI00403AFB3C